MWFFASSLQFPVTLDLISTCKQIEINQFSILTVNGVLQTRTHTSWCGCYLAFSMTICRSGQFGWKHWFSAHLWHTRSWPNADGSWRYGQLVPYIKQNQIETISMPSNYHSKKTAFQIPFCTPSNNRSSNLVNFLGMT